MRRDHPDASILMRIRLRNLDRLLLAWLYRMYPSLLEAVLIVRPQTVIRWHRRGLRAYWRRKSRHVGAVHALVPIFEH